MNKFCITLVLMIMWPISAFAGITYPSDFYDPPAAVYDSGGNRQVFDLVAHGDQEGWQQWQLWIEDTKVLELVGLGKMDEPATIEGSLDDFSITPTPFVEGVTSGTWAYTGTGAAFADPESDFKLYFSVKTGNTNNGGGYNLFVMNEHWYDNVNQTIVWTTEMETLYRKNIENTLVDIGLANKSISHIAFWTGPILTPSGNTEIPEPATMALMGMGLMALAGIGRKKYIK